MANLEALPWDRERLKASLQPEHPRLSPTCRANGNGNFRENASAELPGATEITGRSALLKRLKEQIAVVAPTEASVLIQGESGTGKELAARAIHTASQRRDRPMVRVNCGSIPRDLFESEFFGHSKGAFTGALRDRAGRFESADGGTLFLDEVGEIPLDLQSKLLRVLQEGQYERVGEDKTRQVHVRIIAATNRDLRLNVKQGYFREDLFYRLNVFPIDVPPLRSRKEDIEPLAEYLLRAACHRLRAPELALSNEALSRLHAYDWPGNVRELQNAIERAIITRRDSRLWFDDLGADRSTLSTASNHPPLTQLSSFLTEKEWLDLEKENLSTVLRRAGGRVGGPGGAADLMGIRPTTLRSRLKARGIQHRGL